ncbi:prepilin peptidase [Sediminibacillus massiliensis]|uniref:prepilin peptidase n=1 Tax=Sediminibacillus massiliensis TaxID=1926277 RepID=UPI0009885501|nr:A24 family peptidase [Sediminibacillus massiliensis]
MQLIYLAYFFLIGLIFGSFFNVVGIRVPKGEPFGTERSHCPNCHHQLTWNELIPLFSYLFLKGRCRECRQPISSVYPFVELLTGLCFAYSYHHFGFHVELAFSILLISLLAVIMVADLHYMLIPDRILLFFLPVFIIYRVFVPLTPWWSSILGGLIGIFLLAAIIMVSKGGMGGGDMKLFGLLGIAIGYKGVLIAFFLATIYGSVISGILLALKVINRENPVPFGPFIAAGTITAFFFGDNLFGWYLATFF